MREYPNAALKRQGMGRDFVPQPGLFYDFFHTTCFDLLHNVCIIATNFKTNNP
jgi:hypothetical protein